MTPHSIVSMSTVSVQQWDSFIIVQVIARAAFKRGRGREGGGRGREGGGRGRGGGGRGREGGGRGERGRE